MRACKIGFLTATVITIGTLSYLSKNNDVVAAVNECQYSFGHKKMNNTLACMKVEQKSSWMSWITGDSRSAQFHYLDLLELLTSSEEPQKARTLGPRF